MSKIHAIQNAAVRLAEKCEISTEHALAVIHKEIEKMLGDDEAASAAVAATPDPTPAPPAEAEDPAAKTDAEGNENSGTVEASVDAPTAALNESEETSQSEQSAK